MAATEETDPLRRRAERGSPRGAPSVLAAARATATLAPEPTKAQRRPRLLAIAAAAMLLVAGATAVLFERREDAAPASASDPWCQALATNATDASQIEVDLVVYLDPSATVASDLDAAAEAFQADPRVQRLEVVDQQEAFRRFQALFAEEEILANVRPDDLPPSIELVLREPDLASELEAELRDEPGVFEVRSYPPGPRVLDLLAWPGRDAEVWRSPELPDDLGVYGDGWDALVDEVGATAPPEAASAVATLVDRLGRGPRSTPEEDAPDRRPSFEEARQAASTLQDAAANRCGLEVGSSFEVTTTSSTGGD